MNLIKVTTEKLDQAQITNLISDPSCGGIVVFVGTVRNNTEGRSVNHLFFETYKSMAISEMTKISEKAQNQWPINKMAIYHRIGKLEIGEEAVIIAVSSPHRKEAFAACQFAIDTLKETVPIWKKEVFEDGEVWVSAHP